MVKSRAPVEGATFMQHCDEMWLSIVFRALLRGLQLLSFVM